MTPQVRISVQLSAACAAAGVLMAMGGLMGGGSVYASPASRDQIIEAPLVKMVHSLPVTPRPVAPQPAQKPQRPQEAQPAQKPPCAVQPSSVHRGEPGYRPWIDDDHDDSACER